MPDEVVDTQGARFLHQALVASDLASGLECTEEFENSLVMIKNTAGDGTRYRNCLSDGTSFMWNVQTERNHAGYTFDGIDSNGQNIPLILMIQMFIHHHLKFGVAVIPTSLFLCKVFVMNQ